MSDYWHRRWACPFFSWDDRLSVHCEGRCCVTFSDVEAAKDFFDLYCANQTGWCSCTIAAEKNRAYDKAEKQRRKSI